MSHQKYIIDLLTFVLKFKIFNLILIKRKEFKRRKKEIQLLYISLIIYGNFKKCDMMRISCVLKKLIKNSAKNRCFVSNDIEENGDTCNSWNRLNR